MDHLLVKDQRPKT